MSLLKPNHIAGFDQGIRKKHTMKIFCYVVRQKILTALDKYRNEKKQFVVKRQNLDRKEAVKAFFDKWKRHY